MCHQLGLGTDYVRSAAGFHTHQYIEHVEAKLDGWEVAEELRAGGDATPWPFLFSPLLLSQAWA